MFFVTFRIRDAETEAKTRVLRYIRRLNFTTGLSVHHPSLLMAVSLTVNRTVASVAVDTAAGSK